MFLCIIILLLTTSKINCTKYYKPFFGYTDEHDWLHPPNSSPSTGSERKTDSKNSNCIQTATYYTYDWMYDFSSDFKLYFDKKLDKNKYNPNEIYELEIDSAEFYNTENAQTLLSYCFIQQRAFSEIKKDYMKQTIKNKIRMTVNYKLCTDAIRVGIENLLINIGFGYKSLIIASKFDLLNIVRQKEKIKAFFSDKTSQNKLAELFFKDDIFNCIIEYFDDAIEYADNFLLSDYDDLLKNGKAHVSESLKRIKEEKLYKVVETLTIN